MAEAEEQLNHAIRKGLGSEYDIENVQQDEKVIQMDVALLQGTDDDWTSDSEADSTPSESENDFTSDSDISSSSACSSSSCFSDAEPSRPAAAAATSSSAPVVAPKPGSHSMKRPLIQDITHCSSSRDMSHASSKIKRNNS